MLYFLCKIPLTEFQCECGCGCGCGCVVWVFVYTHTCVTLWCNVHTYIHTYIHTYLHTCIHACIYRVFNQQEEESQGSFHAKISVILDLTKYFVLFFFPQGIQSAGGRVFGILQCQGLSRPRSHQKAEPRRRRRRRRRRLLPVRRLCRLARGINCR